MIALPELGVDNPHSIRMAVVLPAPFAPRKPKISPLCTSSVISFAAIKSPKRLVSLSVLITVSISVGEKFYKTVFDRWCCFFYHNVSDPQSLQVLLDVLF